MQYVTIIVILSIYTKIVPYIGDGHLGDGDTFYIHYGLQMCPSKISGENTGQ